MYIEEIYLIYEVFKPLKFFIIIEVFLAAKIAFSSLLVPKKHIFIR